MDNKKIIGTLKLTSSLMEINGENEFKSRSYSIAAYKLDQLNLQLATLSLEELEKLDGVGKSMATKIDSIIHTGSFPSLDELVQTIPGGVVEMMELQNFGPKKIRVVWQELGVESIEALREACEAGEVAKLKGLGAKTQETILKSIQYRAVNKEKMLFANAELVCNELKKLIKEHFEVKLSETGELRRKCEVVSKIELLIGADSFTEIDKFLSSTSNLEKDEKSSGPFSWKGRVKEPYANLLCRFCSKEQFTNKLLIYTGTLDHMNHPIEDMRTVRQVLRSQLFSSESEAFEALNIPYIEPELREGLFEFEIINRGITEKLVETNDIKGIIHAHSTYSDGVHSLEDMAKYCQELGYQYLGITDHSQTAVYASGLKEDKIKEQHAEIDQLNIDLKPFKIFKGIESDILADGSLDYEPEILQSFDFIIGSIHSVLNMDIKKATKRLINAIKNPFTTMIGHPTARVLLERDGYPIDFKAVIDACVQHDVILEINAHPSRLDLDWRWLRYALDQGMKTCINPDAHKKAGIHDVYYGVQSGRKAGLTATMTLNTMSVDEISDYFTRRKTKALAKV